MATYFTRNLRWRRLCIVMSVVKPLLRGWLHLGMIPFATVAGVLLVVLAPTIGGSVAAGVYAVTAVLLFSVSAVYHRGRWSPRVLAVLKRLDHANIFLLIAGSYTPFAVLLLDRREMLIVLSVVWGGAAAGVLFRIFWVDAPRWSYVPLYLGLGWVAAFFFGPILRAGGVAVLVLLCVGGAFYSLGGLVYGLKRPNPWPRHFGFHEIFHLCTVVAFVTQYAAVSLATYAA